MRCWIRTIFPLLDTSVNPSSSIFLRLSALPCFPVSLFQGRGGFALSCCSRAVPSHELSALSRWGWWFLPPSRSVSVPSPLGGTPFSMRCWSCHQLSFPFLHHQVLSGDRLHKLEEENSFADSFSGFSREAAASPGRSAGREPRPV